jgi:transcriptional regulator with XRE-family HTH domain
MPPSRRKPPLTRELGALGEAIKQTRKERGLTQEGVGELLHTDHKLIGAAERGQRNLRYRTLVDLAGVLEISMGKLIARADRNLAEKEREERATSRNDPLPHHPDRRPD